MLLSFPPTHTHRHIDTDPTIFTQVRGREGGKGMRDGGESERKTHQGRETEMIIESGKEEFNETEKQIKQETCEKH